MDPQDCRWTATLEDGGRQRLARAGERAAAAHLSASHGLVVVATNLRVAVEDLRGELDVVARSPRDGLLVVCEVKTRTSSPHGAGGEVLGARQRARIRRMTAVLLADGTLRAGCVRFDLVTATVPRGGAAPATLVHLPGAW